MQRKWRLHGRLGTSAGCRPRRAGSRSTSLYRVMRSWANLLSRMAWWLFPTGCPVHKAPWMCCRVAALVQHEAPELALSDRGFHVLPRPLKLLVQLGPVACPLYHGTPVLRQKAGILWYCCPQNNRSTAILRGRISAMRSICAKSGSLRLKFSSSSSWRARQTHTL